MDLSNLTNTPGARHRRKRVGRGCGSGMGKTSTRGHKGQAARKGHKQKLGFEGGQMPLVRRLPKRGFNNARFNDKALAVNLADLEKKFETGAEITLEALAKALVERETMDGRDVEALIGVDPKKEVDAKEEDAKEEDADA